MNKITVGTIIPELTTISCELYVGEIPRFFRKDHRSLIKIKKWFTLF